MSEAMATYYCHEHGEDHHWVSRNTHVDDIPWIDKCSICGLYNVERLADYAAAIRADERERIAVQLEEWADDPTSEQPPARSVRFTLTMAARAIRRWEAP